MFWYFATGNKTKTLTLGKTRQKRHSSRRQLVANYRPAKGSKGSRSTRRLRHDPIDSQKKVLPETGDYVSQTNRRTKTG